MSRKSNNNMYHKIKILFCFIAACRNFLKLCKVKYYNWSLFFTVQSNFIAQTGDPTATGKAGESAYGIALGEKARYYEAEKFPKIKHDKVGLLSMVNCGNNMLGSQFFITLGTDLQSLDGEHCIFGEITEGLEIILKFNEVICDAQHRPYQDVRISHTVILEDPYEDIEGLEIPDRSPEPTKEVLMVILEILNIKTFSLRHSFITYIIQ